MILILLIIAFISWMVAVGYAKHRTKYLLDQYGEQLFWKNSNDAIMMIRKLQKLVVREDILDKDIKECKCIISMFKFSLIIIPILIVLSFIAILILYH